ncbi:Guanine nucleotide exchange factor MSS4 [Bagarius yarrelli]|uniref:Guanine nucleotide exchange factor MSS4 n=1 Tax=Bagarius yarrelli TaxID=175774 RepID=A0A556V497_BAGYA|nr:Guanine nucleotide exchange factor MSS4 [Bagarius yarrelli]
MENNVENFVRKGCSDPSVLISEDGKNSKSVVCQRCGSKVLCPGMAVFSDKRLFLPFMQKNNNINHSDGTFSGDTLTAHWLVDDMYTFENVGFTKNVGKIKYLICADCEIGPIGLHNLDEEKSFYIALDRVKHV